MSGPVGPANRFDQLGATRLGESTAFAVFSGVADAVELCLFDDGDERRIELHRNEAGVYSALVEGVGHGQEYGYRVHGPFDPSRGLWCNPAKLLIDPYARALHGSISYGPAVFAYDLDDPSKPSTVDSASSVPRSLVLDALGRTPAKAPKTAWADTVIYEVHVKGATMTHPGVPESLRGTYAGFAHEAFIGHLVDLGVTAVDLLPVHESISELGVVQKGLSNYWGYSTIGFFAPSAHYSAAVRAGDVGGQVAEFAQMVRSLHDADIEVICDVVYNHTAEGDATGPSLSLRGFDAPAYYRHDDDAQLVDTTGCGSSINATNPMAVRLVADSLRYFANEFGVDGFRFDLAPTIARVDGSFQESAPLLEICVSDPVLRNTKLVAEPWDVGCDDSYALGRFPAPFREWNGRYRDDVRDFWRADEGFLGELANRFSGSADVFNTRLRAPTSSINFLTSHDGFTLQDLVSYESKHNEANDEGNRDGTDDNRSWNCGAEGPTDDGTILALRRRQASAMLATLLLSFGVPMLAAGDELGRTQEGNNNAYCQDNAMSWLDWGHVDRERLALTKALIRFRLDHPVLRRRRFFTELTLEDLEWFDPEGATMTDETWSDPTSRCVTIYLDGHRDPDVGDDGAFMVGEDLVVLVNGSSKTRAFTMPSVLSGPFVVKLSSDGSEVQSSFEAGASLDVGPRSLLILSGA